MKRALLIIIVIVCALAAGLCSPARATVPAPLRTPPPAIYKFYDWGTDFATLRPELGAIGSEHMILWQQINPAPGVFDWSRPDRDLAIEAGYRVTLRDGTVIPKPVVIRVSFFLASAKVWSCPNVLFWDGTPGWVYDEVERQGGGSRPVFCGKKVGYALSGCGVTAIVPMWNNATWRARYFEMVRALGEHYGDNPQVVAVVMETGIDGETQMVKTAAGCNWDSLIGGQVPGIRRQFEDVFVPESMRTFREAFPNTPVFISNAPNAYLRYTSSHLAATMVPPVGIKNASGWVDHENHQGYGNNTGLWDMYAVYSDTLPIWIETKFGMGDRESKYWALFAMLHYHPDGISMHEGWLNDCDPAWLRFVQDYLGRSKSDTPGVWTVLRDSEFPATFWGTGNSSGQSGHVGDWAFWLTRTSDNPVVLKGALPANAQASVYARQTRKVSPSRPLTVVVDPGVWFHGQPARVTAISYGAVALAGDAGVIVDAGNGWTATTWTAPADTITITASGPAYVHMVRVEPVEGIPPTKTAAPTATKTATPTATATPLPVQSQPDAGLPPDVAAALAALVTAIVALIWAVYKWLGGGTEE